jgi:hypothetical protein
VRSTTAKVSRCDRPRRPTARSARYAMLVQCQGTDPTSIFLTELVS